MYEIKNTQVDKIDKKINKCTKKFSNYFFTLQKKRTIINLFNLFVVRTSFIFSGKYNLQHDDEE